MPYQLGIPDALRRWGLTVVEVDGWQTRGSAAFAPRGVLVHHTGAKDRTANVPSLRTVLEGRPDLDPPLCQVLMARNQDCYVTAAGKSNHAGVGIWQPGGPGTEMLTGNANTFGLEVENNGIDEPWGSDTYDAMTRATAALLELCGRDERWACGHKEFARPKGRKPDPWGLDMGLFRLNVRDALQGGPMAYTLPDDREPTIREIQQVLKDAGFYAGKIDGDPGSYETSMTRHALHAMKTDRANLLAEVQELRLRATEVPASAVKLAGVVRGLRQLLEEAERP